MEKSPRIQDNQILDPYAIAIKDYFLLKLTCQTDQQHLPSQQKQPLVLLVMRTSRLGCAPMVEREREEGEEEGEIPGCAPMVVAMGEIERKNAALGEIGCTVASEEVVVPSPVRRWSYRRRSIVDALIVNFTQAFQCLVFNYQHDEGPVLVFFDVLIEYSTLGLRSLHQRIVCLILYKRESCSSVDSEEFEPEALVDSGVAHRQDNSEVKTGLEEAHRGWFNSGVDLLELHWWNSAAIVQDPFGALSSWNHSLHYCHWNDILCSHCQHPDRVIGITLMSQGLVGLLSPHVGNLSFLKSIVLPNNSFHGPIPQEIGRLFRLQTIELSNNSFGSGIPNNLSHCSKLEYRDFVNNNLTGNIPAELGSLSRLRTLALNINKLSRSLPDSIANLFTYLSWIDLRFNQIHGSIPSGIGNLLNLTQLSMAVNNLVGPIPSSIDRLHKLCTLFLEQNKFTELPSSIGNLTSLITLNLGENDIHGSIPPSLGNCHNLLELHLYNNNLNGSIPPEIMSLSSISKFRWLGHNALTGSLPSEVGYLKNFANMNVSYNKLSGPIPNTLSNCFSLEWLHLEANSFEGEIPQSLKLMRGLRVLDLSHNNLSGLIPSYLGAISIVGNNDLCGGIAKLDLPPCSSSYSSKNKLSHRTKVILVVVGVVIFLSLLVSFFIFLQLYHVSKKVASSTPSIMHQFLRVSYANLLKATNGFSKANPIGVGSHALVYKGILDQDQMVVAVKVLNLQTGGASRSFMIECKALRAIKHRNLLKI
ncbi:hypothetical protein TEA_023689 [Camellia sinensis var. sinensis]|uniref:Protein kinase domain-containing protein n=1 Tax=Camellia sinensis var. sinensis TaxID=542762 RepID=A0A4S4DTY1_CAMSN|nr:hypothetical protein TEA_023689 [Camellia sinensis var. sinensis]